MLIMFLVGNYLMHNAYPLNALHLLLHFKMLVNYHSTPNFHLSGLDT
jgi:hypothetical protein